MTSCSAAKELAMSVAQEARAQMARQAAEPGKQAPGPG